MIHKLEIDTGRRFFHLEVGTEDWEPTLQELQELVDLFTKVDNDSSCSVIATKKGVRVTDLSIPPQPNLKIWTRRPELIPRRSHPGDSGLDLRADLQLRDGSTFSRLEIIKPGHMKIIPTGVKAAVDPGFEIQVRLRGSSAAKGLILTNAPGTVDSGYRGELVMLLHNVGSTDIAISDLERICQMVVCSVSLVEPVVVSKVEQLGSTSRGDGKLGSTGSS